MKCLFCREEIEDGDIVIDGQTGQAVVREEEPEWTGEMEYGSQLFTVHKDCFQRVEEMFKQVIE